MTRIELGEFETGDEVIEGFKDFLQMVAAESFKVREPNPEAQRIVKVVAEDDLDNLNPDDVEKVFADAGFYFERVVVKLKKKKN